MKLSNFTSITYLGSLFMHEKIVTSTRANPISQIWNANARFLNNFASKSPGLIRTKNGAQFRFSNMVKFRTNLTEPLLSKCSFRNASKSSKSVTDPRNFLISSLHSNPSSSSLYTSPWKKFQLEYGPTKLFMKKPIQSLNRPTSIKRER